ncbi:MAG TPA: EF-P lysine aminoacylase EpmA [Nevskiaceae bacterium]|nr:EF-P lysine aminoacylase EpmA [Nevskiaceae bacterium]
MPENNWKPSASIATLKARAELYGSVRAFFSSRGLLEVSTPLLSAHATVDKHIDSFRAGDSWLHTSPEFAMKRLLAAGSGAIWQLGPVFRREEAGRFHNPEFTLLEWYRPGWDHHRLMDEVDELLRTLGACARPCARLSYRDAFLRHAGLDPFAASLDDLRARTQLHELDHVDDRDTWLDLLMSHVVGPQLGRDAPEFLYDFPASQAALARVRGEVAERFELFWRGIELANGFHELTDAVEQEARFRADQAWRRMQGRDVPPYDAHLIAALRAGLPTCAGVALGIDRLLMLKLGLPDVASTLAFAADRA